MIRMAGRLISLCAAIGLTLLVTSGMMGVGNYIDIVYAGGIPAPNYILTALVPPPPPLTLFTPRLPVVRVPRIVCEPLPGDPEAATDCDAAAQKG